MARCSALPDLKGPVERIRVIIAEQVRGLAALAWLTLVSNVLAYACWFRIIRALPAAVALETTGWLLPCPTMNNRVAGIRRRPARY